MEYKKIDRVLMPWAESRNMHVYTRYHDGDVRTMIIDTAKGGRYQIWVEPPDCNDQVSVNVWDFKKRRREYLSSFDALNDSLDNTYEKILQWDSS